MRKTEIEKFSIKAIAGAVSRSDLAVVRSALFEMIGAVLDVSGKVRKVAKREGVCRLVIEPGDVPGFIVFADCRGDAENLRNHKIRKGSLVSVRGNLQSFGAMAVSLDDCKLHQVATLKKGKF
jgi:hypothetical protein